MFHLIKTCRREAVSSARSALDSVDIWLGESVSSGSPTSLVNELEVNLTGLSSLAWLVARGCCNRLGIHGDPAGRRWGSISR